jgi:deazaflavin-dependent oxidoreductase (nitroreductase family)
MPLPKAVTRLNRRFTNPLLGRLAGRLPPLAIVVHRGRRSGRAYRTPVMAFPTGDEVLIALTYGLGVDWLRNVLAAGECRLIYGGREMALARPRLVERAAPPASLPALVRLVLRLTRVHDYLWLMRDPAPAGAAVGIAAPRSAPSQPTEPDRLDGPGRPAVVRLRASPGLRAMRQRTWPSAAPIAAPLLATAHVFRPFAPACSCLTHGEQKVSNEWTGA